VIPTKTCAVCGLVNEITETRCRHCNSRHWVPRTFEQVAASNALEAEPVAHTRTQEHSAGALSSARLRRESAILVALVLGLMLLAILVALAVS
jgi:hypothetical protein